MTKDEIYLRAFTAAMAALTGARANELIKIQRNEEMEREVVSMAFVAVAVAEQVLYEKDIIDEVALEDAKKDGAAQ